MVTTYKHGYIIDMPYKRYRISPNAIFSTLFCEVLSCDKTERDYQPSKMLNNKPFNSLSDLMGYIIKTEKEEFCHSLLGDKSSLNTKPNRKEWLKLNEFELKTHQQLLFALEEIKIFENSH